MDIVGGIAAATEALGIAKALRGIEKDYDAATYKAQIADLISSLADAKLALSEAKEALSERDKEIERLKASFEEKSRLVKGKDDYNYKADDNGQPVGYPVCPKCEQVDGRVVQLKQDGGIMKARCPVCASTFLPVSCYLPRNEGGPATKEEERKRQREIESARISASLNKSGGWLA